MQPVTKPRALHAFTLALALVLACDQAAEPQPPHPAAVSVTPSSAELTAVGATVRLSAAVRDQNGQPMPSVPVSWTSGAPAVAAVDGSGEVTAVANGSATITVTAGSVSATGTVTVAQVVSAVAVSPATDTLVAFGDTVRLGAEATDANGHGVAAAEFSWSSSDTSVARVDGAGLVTGVAGGSATITAKAGTVSATASVTVAQVVSSVEVAPAAVAVVEADTVRLSAVAVDANGHEVGGAAIAWASADTLVAVVDAQGLVTGVAAGDAVVVASTASGVAGKAEIEVRYPPYPVHVHYLGDVHDFMKPPIEEAAVYWAEVLAPSPAAEFVFDRDYHGTCVGGTLSFTAGEVLEPGLHLYIYFNPPGRDPPGWGWACGMDVRGYGSSDVPQNPVGLIGYNRAFVEKNVVENDRWFHYDHVSMMKHEIGHQLGIGLYHDWRERRTNPDTLHGKLYNVVHTGQATIAAFDRMGGGAFPSRKVPLHGRGAHWDGCAGHLDRMGSSPVRTVHNSKTTELTLVSLMEGYLPDMRFAEADTLDSSVWNLKNTRWNCVDGRSVPLPPSSGPAAEAGGGHPWCAVINGHARR